MATLKGKWQLNDVLDTTGTAFEQAVEFAASFVDEGVNYTGRFTGIKYDPAQSNLVEYTIGSTDPVNNSYWAPGDNAVVYIHAPNYDTSAWSYAGINIVDFGTAGQTVSDEFMTWLTANAVEVIESTTAATITYNGAVIAELNAGQTATLACAGMQMMSDVVVRAEGGSGSGECSGKHIVEASELPTENIDENAVYLCGGAYYVHLMQFLDYAISWGGSPISYKELATSQGMEISFHITATRPVEGILESTDTVGNLYYIVDESVASAYQDGAWNDMPVNGVVSDINDIPEGVEGYYVVGGVGWKEYISPTGTLAITENGIYDATTYKSAVVSITGVTIVETAADLPTEMPSGSMAIVLREVS